MRASLDARPDAIMRLGHSGAKPADSRLFLAQASLFG
jgi:hypothetical protein